MPKGTVRRIGIVGAGFSGTACLAMIHQLTEQPTHVFLFDKSGEFAAGHAYRTPYPYHLLNARARDMSAFEHEPDHFTKWLQNNEEARLYISHPEMAGEEFVPRFLYRNYLQSILDGICADKNGLVRVTLSADEVIDVASTARGVALITNSGQTVMVDKVVLATGVASTGDLPFPVNAESTSIIAAWNYTDIEKIHVNDPVLIVGTGLSMIDAVLTLYHRQHRGKITAVSRHGLLPLPHSINHVTLDYAHRELPVNTRQLTRLLRTASQKFEMKGGDWRTIINTLRPQLPSLWRSMDMQERRRFLRHVLPYWNVHRHRVHDQVYQLLDEMRASGRLEIVAGYLLHVKDGVVDIKLRHSQAISQCKVKTVINCLGFSFKNSIKQQPVMASLVKQGIAQMDELGLGLVAAATGEISDSLYTIGPPLQGEAWETIAVPEIRKQCSVLAAELGKDNKECYEANVG